MGLQCLTIRESILVCVKGSFQGGRKIAMSAKYAPCGLGGKRMNSSLPTPRRPIDLKELTKRNGLSIKAVA